MARVSTYLNFPRNTEEAFNFYKSVFGGEFIGGIQRFSTVPHQEGTPEMAEADKNLVMHVALPILGGHVLMGTDAPESIGFKVNFGNNIYINLEPDTRAETDALFNKLSECGKVEMQLQEMFWGDYFGSCTDKFGVQWMFNCVEKSKRFYRMDTKEKTFITVQTAINAPIEKIWKLWTTPEHIIKWNNASDDWHTPFAENDLRTGGKFLSRMEAKDGSFGFDFGGVYDSVKTNEAIDYTIGDGRKVKITFTSKDNETKVIETFEAENQHTIEMQQSGWQAILDNFKKYAEAN